MYRWIVGLGNYPNLNPHLFAQTRHNMGGDMVLAWAKRLGLKMEKKGMLMHASCLIDSSPVTLAIISGYINHSGFGLAQIIPKHEISKLLVIYDDVELPYGKALWKVGGSDKGHNGLRNISLVLGREYGRLRIGVGKQIPLKDYVLAQHGPEDWHSIQKVIDFCFDHLKDIINHNFKGCHHA